MANPQTSFDNCFDTAEREALYKTIFTRRDVRGQFRPDPIPDDVLTRVLMAAHYAPSVGFMQPWNFVVIREDDTKRKVHDLFETAHGEAAEMFEGANRDTYRRLKLEGILESPVNICITCDKDRAGPVVIGRTHEPVMDVYSSVCAVQNLWLAARAEGLGLGWVSILDHTRLREVLNIPDRVVPVAYLCLGYVSHFFDRPELQSAGWCPRLPLEELVNFERFGQGSEDPDAVALLEQIRQTQHRLEDGGYSGNFAQATCDTSPET
ncbi:5,6-dimethylbenzimidazole synthase [Aliiroseovarius crassostreae]|uniref:5,6-dimethylbenzimidazole synthase n=1 Tax=Aliiroseovarius crassostreae TaxID=154981 RepID=UPI0021AE54FD|nr:5,6-dimethylbenzimidazole synthase [Aliiroseovarius crassostreae]UWQ09420.1 5,6-dimethylbenzimidazole synthase [Aliiroseovarius crassostreae]